MATDMDIEMDIDMGFSEQDLAVGDIEIIPEFAPAAQANNGSAPNDSSAPDALQPTPTKIHLRGVDNLTTNDIKSFASEYFSTSKPTVEWIDDTSANLVYETPELAQEALIAFAAVEIADVSQLPVLQTLPAKSFPLHPQTNLEVRIAIVGDRKQPGARERSRFYLFNPEYDPAERRKRAGGRGGNRYRDRDDDGYRSQRYDEREQRKRQRDDEDAGFTANLYDDDEAALTARRKKVRQNSHSSGSFDGRDSRRARFRGAGTKELFPERGGTDSGRLRDRSASPLRDRDEDDDARSRKRDMAASANRQKAQMIKAQLRDSTTSKELFPNKTTHRRSSAFDAADATADLFARKMPVPFMDGANDQLPYAGLPLASRISSKSNIDTGRLNIRGAAKAIATHDFAIKGAADGGVKELFPAGGNAGKELFTNLEGRGRRRNKAEDLFY
ncbi:Nuclear cap-binding subunit 3 [Hyphodiscus hymeniophilus]|uniref:Nuclear cap-binding subunit 3 n=1 Tax=Hyphodiscus hymeniophilus TaxID=353542 RepID=A0A9P7AUX1_9HELO|nr:Nuclear cap-binding subunit 3 [Hyphodiscus hymeniophilus]